MERRAAWKPWPGPWSTTLLCAGDTAVSRPGRALHGGAACLRWGGCLPAAWEPGQGGASCPGSVAMCARRQQPTSCWTLRGGRGRRRKSPCAGGGLRCLPMGLVPGSGSAQGSRPARVILPASPSLFHRRGDGPKHHAERRLETHVWTDPRPGSWPPPPCSYWLWVRRRMRGPWSLPCARPMTGGQMA